MSSFFDNPRHPRVASTNCGCYVFVNNTPKYLPQVEVKAHTTILATTSRTNLTQTFINSANAELRYVFPLYDGVSVVAFTCTVGSRVIKGVVKERQKAQQVYDAAKAQGQVTGLFKQSLEAADTFTTTIGNVPVGEKVHVDVTYLGELKHDAQVDGLRFTIPTQIAPRYGDAVSLGFSNVVQKGSSFTIDVEMPDGSSIKSVQSPSHPLSVDIGTTSTTKSQDPSLQRASATLQQGKAHLEQDFIVQVVATKLGEPSAILETHPTIPNQRAIMATLVPKFKLPSEKPEIVFLCDRSGSMAGQESNLKSALEIFLKSVPVGVKFNICSFGSSFSFLWDRSQTYSQETLDKAVQHVQTFESNYGGTEIYQPFEATFKRRYKDMNLEVFLLTDGEIWDQDRLFNLINTEVAESKGTARVFSLGIGAGASTSLIEGIARAGNGFAQTVGEGEKMDKMVVRMLRGALSPHIADYSLEVKYERENSSTDDDDFELVEKFTDGLKIDTTKVIKTEEIEVSKKPISLFDASTEDDDDTIMTDATATDNKYDHLPAVSVPRYMQTPGRIPPLFPFNRTTVYVLLSDATPDQRPKSILLKGTSRHGPLELEIPITMAAKKDSVIHRLAARKEVKELEEGRGWLTQATKSDGKLLKEKYDGQFSDMVEREAVRLGVTYQVGGKWCSFVAVEEKEGGQEVEHPQEATFSNPGTVSQPARSSARSGVHFGMASTFAPTSAMQACSFSSNARSPDFVSSSNSGGSGLFGTSNSGGLFGSAPGGPPAARGGLFGSALPPPPAPHTAEPPIVQAAALTPFAATVSEELLVEDCNMDEVSTTSRFDDHPGDGDSVAVLNSCTEEAEESESDGDVGFAFFDDGPSFTPCQAPPPAPKRIGDMGPLQALTSLQSFSGSWSWSADLERVLGVTAATMNKLEIPSVVKDHAEKDSILATACAVLFFKKKLSDERDTWEMLVEKAEGWLEDNIGEGGVSDLDNAIEKFF
ncbi:hypothetical protein FGRMN_7744 [Fusarium graminum]|nr:hypothetical protein FGRMN_7744 [Fusarium graminum]